MPDGVRLPVVEAGDAELARRLELAIEGEVRFGRHERMLYATDASLYQVEPIGVVLPRSAADVEAVVKVCAEAGVAILGRGGGTSLAGQAIAPAVVIDCSAAFGRLLEIDPERRTARFEPGLILDRLNDAAAVHGLMFGPDVASASHATLGGMIGNNSAGAHSILFGHTVEHVAAVSVVMADGGRLSLGEGAATDDRLVGDLTRSVAEIIMPLAPLIRERFPRTRRHVDGYNLDILLEQLELSLPGGLERVNLAHLICGSEGTLAVMTEATVRLVERPRDKGLALLAFESVDEALELLPEILASTPAAVELIDDVILGLAARNPTCRRLLSVVPRLGSKMPGAILYVEYFGTDDKIAGDALADLGRRHADVPQRTFVDPGEMADAWQLRKSGEPLLHSLPGPRKPLSFIEDLAVNADRLGDFVRAFRTLVERHGTTASFYAHASVGCLHIRPMLALREAGDRRTMLDIAEAATDLVRDYGGALSGEHGDGRARSHLLERFYGPELCRAFAAIKRLFDPDGRLNPGVIVEPAPMLERLRTRPARLPVEVPAIDTFYRYDREHGFAEAVTACNGAGVCRKTSGGTMCPSYRATLSERHSTRGRGNALRLAITGQLGPTLGEANFLDLETLATLDLCLGCKACKSECPSNVDVAKLKSEYLAQHYRSCSTTPRHARRAAEVRRLLRIGATFAPLSALISRFPPTAAAVKRLLGVAPGRSLPTVGPSLEGWFDRRAPVADAASRPVVILLPDCFTIYGETAVGQAAVTVLERLGYRVLIPKLGCCGRAALSQGLVGEAEAMIRPVATALLECMRGLEAVALVGCEPSCVSAITDDWLDLDVGLERNDLEWLIERTMLIETFIETASQDHPDAEPLHAAGDAASRSVLFHGHCHQKALWGVQPSVALVKRFVGDGLNLLDTGCCGLAGSFGYAPSRFELSMAIGELDLFPAIRAEPQASILAPGASCRHQIRDGTGRRAIHPIELVAKELSGSTCSSRSR